MEVSAGSWILPAVDDGIRSGAEEKDDTAKVMKLYDKAESKRSIWLPMWQDCYDYAIPARGDGFYTTVQGRRRTDKIFDETAVVSVQEFASRMQAGIVPNYARWALLTPGTNVPDDAKKGVAEWMEKATDIVFNVIWNSNFAQEAHESFIDLAVGTGAMLVEPGDVDHPVKFTAIPLTQITVGSGPFDQIDKVFRKRKMKVSDILVTWPDAKLPDAVQKDIAKDPNKEIEVLEAVFRDWDDKGNETHQYRVILKQHKETILRDRFKGDGSNPWVVFRWSKCAGEDYGRGPLLNALAAIKTANLTVEMILENAQMAIAGMWQVEDDGVINADNIRLIPGTVIPVQAGSKGMQPLVPGSKFDVGQMVLQDMRTNIKKALYDEMLGPMDKTPMSAAEVHARMADMSRRVGSAFGRLQNEFVQPIIKRVVHLLMKQGLLPKDCPKINGHECHVESTSPLARTQNYEDVSAIDRWLEVITVRFGPQVLNIVAKQDVIASDLAEKLGVNSKYVRSVAEQAALGKQIAQMAQAQQAPQENAGAAIQKAMGG